MQNMHPNLITNNHISEKLYGDENQHDKKTTFD